MTRSRRGSSPIPYPGETISSSASSVTMNQEDEAVGGPDTQGQVHPSDNLSNAHDGNSQTTDVSIHQDGDQNGTQRFSTVATSGSLACPVEDAVADDDDANLDRILAGAGPDMTEKFVRSQARVEATTWDQLEVPNVLALADRWLPTTYNHPHPGQTSMSPEMQHDAPSDTLSDDTSRQSPEE